MFCDGRGRRGCCAPSMVGSYSSTKWLWMSWMVKQLFPTPPPPTTTSLYSRRNCRRDGQPIGAGARGGRSRAPAVAQGGVAKAFDRRRAAGMHTFDAIAKDWRVRRRARGEGERGSWTARAAQSRGVG